MAAPYIWLGKNDEIATGAISIEPVDAWTVRPLLGWKHDATDPTQDQFTIALLVRADNPALHQLLGLLDGKKDEDVQTDPTWQVYRFDRAPMTLGTTVSLAAYPTENVPAFIAHNVTGAVDLKAAPSSVVNLGIEALKLKGPPKATLKAPANGEPLTLTLTFVLGKLELQGLNVAPAANAPFDLGETVLRLEIDGTNGTLKINDMALSDGQGVVSFGDRVAFIFEGDAASPRVGFEVEIGKGSCTYAPLIPGIEASKVVLQWDRFRTRFYDDRVGLAAPPPGAGDGQDGEFLTAEFFLPLAEAEVGPATANFLAKLVPAAQADDVQLVPLHFSVKIKRPDDTLPLLWAVERTGQTLGKAGFLVQEGLNTLKAVFKSDEMVSTKLTGFLAPLKELTRLAESAVSFTLEKISGALIEAFQSLDAFNTTDYPLRLMLRVGGSSQQQQMECLVVLRLNLWAGRLADNRAYFYLASSSSHLDMTSFAIQWPTRPIEELEELALPNKDQHDGYLDFESHDLVLDLWPAGQKSRPRLIVLFPGDLGKPTGADDDVRRQRRVRLQLEDFDPEAWPDPGSTTLQLRLGARGLTFAAKADPTIAAAIPVANTTLPMRLVEAHKGLKSGLVVINNQIRYANLAGRIAVPGFESLEADVQLGLRRVAPEGPPEVTAVIDLDRTDRKPLARLTIPVLKVELDNLQMQLSWKKNGENADWDLRAWATGAVSITNEVGSTGGVKGLDQPRAIPFRDLNLVSLHEGSGQLPLGFVKSNGQAPPVPADGAPHTDEEPARFELLDGQFRIEFHRSVLRWNLDSAETAAAPARSVVLQVDQARFAYQAASGDLDVAIDAGQIELGFNLDKRSLQFGMPSSLGLAVRIGTQIAFSGEVGWDGTDGEHFFRADGSLRMTGFPEVGGGLKLGTGIKADGSTAPNLAVFAELPYEADLFSGVVLKRMGLGLGLNNRLAAFGSRPDPRTILARIDEADPMKSRNWSFVSEGGVYVSVVATAMMASNRGDDSVPCAYVARLLLSIDTNLDIVAVARVWLFCSPSFLIKGDNGRRPALVGAAVLRPREQTFSLVAQTSPRPAIEANEMLADLLGRVQARFSFYISSELTDFYLEELSYSEEVFGIPVTVTGSYRIAVGRFGMLIRAMLALQGTLEPRKLEAGTGGFTFSGGLQLGADFGGLVTRRGLAAYGAVHVGISFRVSAYVLVPTVTFETISFAYTFSFTISIPYLKCKRWRCKWRTREITKEVTVQVTLVVPVVKLEPIHLAETSLELVLDGALAFDESGGIGFSGTVAISTMIFGTPLRIAPRFDYRREVVDSVQTRVRAVEDHLNRLRGLPRPTAPQSLPQDNASEPESTEAWYYYTSCCGEDVYHLLVPSPENPQWWYTPRAAGLSQYANLPRDTGQPVTEGGASAIERQHLSPFRDTVMRMVLPFVAKDGGGVKRVVDLAMPWDRGNCDALPDESKMPNDDDRIALVMRLAQMETAFLNTAAQSDLAYDGLDQMAGIGEKERAAWKKQEPESSSFNAVEIVSDPRPESGSRIYWSLADQITRPDTALPYRYRPVRELVAEGFAGVDRRDDIGRLLRYEELRRRVAIQGRIEDVDPKPARRLTQSRAALLSTILADFTRDPRPTNYSPIDEIELDRKDADRSVVPRRRAPLWVMPEGVESKYVVRLTYAILENNTDLDLQPGSDGTVKITFKCDKADGPQIVDLVEKVPLLYNSSDRLEDVLAQRHEPLCEFECNADGKICQVQVTRTSANSDDAPDAPRESLVIFDLLPKGWAEADRKRQVGLFAVTKAEDGLELDLARVRVLRNEPDSGLPAENESVEWQRDVAVHVVPMNDPGREDPVEAVQRWVSCLPPCQEYLSGDELGSSSRNGEPSVDSEAKADQDQATPQSPCVRVRLPVRFQDELLKTQLPRLNGFEIYRRFPWETKPVKIAEGVPPTIRPVMERGRTVLMVESFLFSEDFSFNHDTGRFEGVAAGVIPDVTPIEYSLCAVPFGRLPSNRASTLRHWPAVKLHVPARESALPPLGVVLCVHDLIQPDNSESVWKIPIHLVDSRHATWQWPKKSWEALEIWAEPQRIRSSGAYAIEDDGAELDPRTVENRSIRGPHDLTAERVPESTAGKIRVATLTRGRSSWQFEINSEGKLQPGRAYRLFVRPAVPAQMPLVQPMSVYLARHLPTQITEDTPLCHAKHLELIARSERDRILSPITLNGMAKARAESWVPANAVQITGRTRSDEEVERLRIAWDHLSEFDAGVEILVQDNDEPHRVDRRLVTVQEESVFQRAIRDFRNPSLWQSHPEPLPEQSWDTLDDLRATPRVADPIELLLWRDERNPIIERVREARKTLMAYVNDYCISVECAATLPNKFTKDNHGLVNGTAVRLVTMTKLPNDLRPDTTYYIAGADANTFQLKDDQGRDVAFAAESGRHWCVGVGKWGELYRGLAEYLFAMFAYQRSPLGPAAAVDRVGLEALVAASRALLLGKVTPPVKEGELQTTLEDLKTALEDPVTGEAGLRKVLDELAKIDLATMTVHDSPDDYARIKLELQDIDLARKLAAIVERRWALADDLLNPESPNDDESLDLDDERLPGFATWQTLVNRAAALKAANKDNPPPLTWTKKLLDLFGGIPADSAAPADVTVAKAAALVRWLLEKIRDPSVLLKPGEPKNEDYRTSVAKLVPQAAGLIAALDALKRDAQSRRWTLLQRPHHQLAVESSETKGREPVKNSWRAYFPDRLNGSNRSEDGQPPSLDDNAIKALDRRFLIVPFVNLLERFGFAVDLAVVDALNQPLPQARLHEWIAGQAWPAIQTSIGTAKHDVVVIAGREPDTDRNQPETDLDEDQSLGYAFVKLAVVPRTLLADLLGRSIKVTVKAVTPLSPPTSSASTITFIPNPLKGLDALKGLGTNSIKLQWGTEAPPVDGKLDLATGTVTIQGTSPTAGTVVTVTCPEADQKSLLEWLERRSLTSRESKELDKHERAVVARMAEAWWEQIAVLQRDEKTAAEPKLGHVIVETRGRRWATVPALGGRAHLDWQAPDAAGRAVQVALRRVSRYEALLRWAQGTAVPTTTRLYGLEATECQSVELRRRMHGGEEPRLLPVVVSPHPTRIEFIYALPTSGARAMVSGLSARRTGYRGVSAQFVHQCIKDGHEKLGEFSRHEALVELTVLPGSSPEKWQVPFKILEGFHPAEGIVVFSQDCRHVQLSTKFVKSPSNQEQGELTFGEGNIDLIGVPSGEHNKTLALMRPLADPVLEFGSTEGKIVPVKDNTVSPGNTMFRLIPGNELGNRSDRFDDDPRSYTGQLLIVVSDGKPKFARMIESYSPSDQVLKLTDGLKAQAWDHVRILHGGPIPRRTRLSQSENRDPVLFRNERLLSVPALPYYREYAVDVRPQFEITPLPGQPADEQRSLAFARRRPSLLAIHGGLVVSKDPTASETRTYVFRIFLTRQGDLLTPQEMEAAAELDQSDLLSISGLLGGTVSAADLPDLACQYHVLWKLPDPPENALPPVGSKPFHIPLVDLCLPGHPEWKDGSSGPVLIRNRVGLQMATLAKGTADPTLQRHEVIQVWRPSPSARPVYLVQFQVTINKAGLPTFGDAGRGVVQVFRDGHRSEPLPIVSMS